MCKKKQNKEVVRQVNCCFILKVQTGRRMYVVWLVLPSGGGAAGFLNRRDVATSQIPLADSCSCGGNRGGEKRWFQRRGNYLPTKQRQNMFWLSDLTAVTKILLERRRKKSAFQRKHLASVKLLSVFIDSRFHWFSYSHRPLLHVISLP